MYSSYFGIIRTEDDLNKVSQLILVEAQIALKVYLVEHSFK